MKNLTFFGLLVSVFSAMLLSNCASLTGFTDGRVIGKNNGEFVGSLNFSQTPKFSDFADSDSILVGDDFRFTFPSVEVGGRYGVADKIDIGVRMNSNLNLAVDGKFQILGDHESKTALSLGVGVGTFGLLLSGVGLWNFQVSAPFSVHPTEKVAWYVAPRFIGQFATAVGETSGLLKYTGGNTGFLFGDKVKFGIDLGYYRWGAGGDSVGLFQFGGGMKFRFGDNEGSSSSKGKGKKKK